MPLLWRRIKNSQHETLKLIKCLTLQADYKALSKIGSNKERFRDYYLPTMRY